MSITFHFTGVRTETPQAGKVTGPRWKRGVPQLFHFRVHAIFLCCAAWKRRTWVMAVCREWSSTQNKDKPQVLNSEHHCSLISLRNTVEKTFQLRCVKTLHVVFTRLYFSFMKRDFIDWRDLCCLSGVGKGWCDRAMLHSKAKFLSCSV